MSENDYVRIDIEGVYDITCVRGKENYIKKCVDEHDSLVFDNEQLQNYNNALKKQVDNLIAEVERLKEENEQLRKEYAEQVQILLDDMKPLNFDINELRQALKLCSPLDVYTVEETGLLVPFCKFCRAIIYHADNCEYVRLIGGGE